MPHSRQACSAPSKQMPGSNPKGDRSSIASISASSTISIPSSEPSASKPRDFNLKREQNPRYRQHNGLILRFLLAAGGDALLLARCPLHARLDATIENLDDNAVLFFG